MPVMHDEAALVWAATLGCLECNPWPVRADDVDHPDELRVDLDPTPGVPWDDVRRVALMAREVLAEHGLTGFPKTSGKRGIHVNARVERGHGFTNTRRAALAFAREVERRMPGVATTAWWKEERQGVFLDYNQNARDRTVASAYSIRPMPDARVSTPLAWDEVADVEPERFTVRTVPGRLREIGDPGAGDRRPRRVARLPAGARGARRRGRAGRRAVAAALPEGRRRAAPREPLAREEGRRVGGVEGVPEGEAARRVGPAARPRRTRVVRYGLVLRLGPARRFDARAARTCSSAGSGRRATGRTSPRAGTGRTASGRSSPRPRAPARSATHSGSFPPVQRLGPPGARPPSKLGPSSSRSTPSISRRSAALNDDVWPT